VIADLIIRFVVGGAMVSLFAVVGELFAPKTFSGIFGAAPSVALATLALTSHKQGHTAVADLAQAMLFGTAAMLAYCAILSVVVRRLKMPAWLEAGAAWALWFAIAFPLWARFLRA
jgi:uncharacterized membrane protein (GlpM family)